VGKRSALTKQTEYLHARGPQLQLGQFEAGLSEDSELPGPGARCVVHFQQGPLQRGRRPVRRGHERMLGVELWPGGEPVAQLSACFRCVFVVPNSHSSEEIPPQTRTALPPRSGVVISKNGYPMIIGLRKSGFILL
jgi:hypothetical protein